MGNPKEIVTILSEIDESDVIRAASIDLVAKRHTAERNILKTKAAVEAAKVQRDINSQGSKGNRSNGTYLVRAHTTITQT